MLARIEALNPAGDHARDPGGSELAVGGQNPVPLFVELADHSRADICAPVVELFLQLVLDDGALFLDDQDFLQALGELPHAVALQRPDHAHLEQGEADVGGHGLVDPEVVQRLAHVEIGLAGGDDAEAPLGAVDHRPVQMIGPGEGQCRIELAAVQSLLLLHHVQSAVPADIEAVGRHLEVVRPGDDDALGVDVAGRRGFHRIGDALEADPAAGIARHGPAIEAEVQELLHAGRRERRHHRVHEGVLALVRGGRGLGRMVVAGQQQDAAVLGAAGHVAVPEDVAAAVDARPLAVPHGIDAIDRRIAEKVGLLGAPDRRRRQVLVQARPEDDVVLVKQVLGFPQLLIQPAQRRAAVAGDVAAGVEADRAVTLLLHQRQAHQGLGAGQEDAPALERVLVVKADGSVWHGSSP